MSTEPVVEVAHQELVVEVAYAGTRGPAGPQGDAGTTITATAAINLGGNRAVMLNDDGEAAYANQANPHQCGRVMGITTGAALAGAPVTIQTLGEMVEPSWNWAPGIDIWLSTTGLLTQSVPPAGVVLVLGFPTSPTSMFIDIESPVLQV